VTAYSERRILPYTPEQMFGLVAGVERYPEFLPWCMGARILRRHDNVFYADLIIGWKVIRERFGSKVTLLPPSRIHVDYINGPLKYLHNDWQFMPAENGGTEVDFHVDFEFKSRALAAIMGGVFGELVHRMVGAFELRAHALYGPGAHSDAAPDSAGSVQPLKQKA
jgi:coenzyme Q-binding protein COQ10